ncbi:MAG: glycosyltransferase family 4 protein [Candidatus Altiarchaeota archaeon]|nr:glycosyltransferase family 4 protein [Candidatus Altiarchaeota archaeon]
MRRVVGRVPFVFPDKGEQLDFTSLPNPVGSEWGDLMGHRQKLKIGVMEVTSSDLDGIGGVETYVKGLNSELLRNHSIDIHTVYRSVDRGSKDRVVACGGSRLFMHPVYTGEETEVHRLKRLVKMSRRVNDILKTEDIDIVNFHGQLGSSMILPAMIPYMKGTPVVVTSHGEFGIEGFRHPIKAVGLSLGSAFTRFATVRTGVSAVAADSLGPGSIVVGSLCDIDFFNPENSEVNPESFRKQVGAQNKKLILYPARITGLKGQMDFVKMCEKLPEMLEGFDFKAVVVGPSFDEDYLRQIREYIVAHDLGERVVIMDGVDHKRLRDMYAASDLVVFPTYQEGLGLTAVESLAMKTPVVAYNTGGIPEVVEEGKTGFLVAQGDIGGLCEKAKKVLTDPNLSASMGDEGRKQMIEKFSPEKLAQRYMQLYKRIISGQI